MKQQYQKIYTKSVVVDMWLITKKQVGFMQTCVWSLSSCVITKHKIIVYSLILTFCSFVVWFFGG